MNSQRQIAAIRTFLRHRLGQPHAVPLLTWGIGVTLTVAFWRGTAAQHQQTEAARFGDLAGRITRTIEHRLREHEQVLHGIRGLFSASKSVERGEFREFVRTMQRADQPGATGFGFVRYVRPGQLETFLRSTRADGAPDFAVHPAGRNEDRFVVDYIEPFAADSARRGLDLGADPVARAAAVAAVGAENRVTLTAPIRTARDGRMRVSFMLFLPVFANGAPTLTERDRWSSLLGWVCTPLAMDALVADAGEDGGHQLDFEIFDRDAAPGGLLLFDADDAVRAEDNETSHRVVDRPGQLQLTRRIAFGGREWSVHLSTLPAFHRQAVGQFPWLVLAGGLAITALAGHAAGFSQRSRAKALKLADEMTVELRHEIAEREHIGRTLRAVSDFQNAILRSADYGIISTTPEGVIRVFNPAAERLLGYSAAELVGVQTPAVFHDRGEVAERARRFGAELGTDLAPGFEVFVLKSRRGLPNEHEWTYIRKDGSRLPVLLSVTAIRDDAGGVSGFLGVVKDISERKQAQRQIDDARRATEHALREVELQRDALDQHAVVAITDPTGRLQYVNERFCALSGHPRDELLGAHHRLVASGQHPPEFWREFWATLAAGRIWRGELCNRTKAGDLYWIESTVVPFRDPAGQIGRYVAISTDITERKHQTVALQQARDAAEHANRAKSDFLAVMSHEIRTPMNAVLGFAELLGDTDLDAAQREFVGALRASGQSLRELINDILDCAKIEAGRLEVKSVEFDALAVVESVARVLSIPAGHKGLSLAVRRAPGLAPVLAADPGRTRQVLTNLVGNALKFTARGGVTVGLEPWRFPDRPGLKFTITDTGPGIPAGQQQRLFQKFVQVDAGYSREAGGTGLGLAICKRLVERMGGQIGLESVAGQGSTFWFTLPSPVPAEAAPGAPPIGPGTAAEVAPERPLRVLLVDDNPVNRMLALAFLAKLNCVVTTAGDGFAAVKFAQTEGFDLALMDCQMPGMDGFQATENIRADEARAARPRRLPIIALTASASDSRDRCFRTGMDFFLTKPYQLADLKSAIATVLAHPPPLPPAPDRPPATAASPDTAMDPGRALRMADDNPELLAILAQSFLPQSDTLLSAIRDAVAARDAGVLRERAHALKGSVSVFAAAQVSALTLALEKHPSPPDWAELSRLAERLDVEMDRLRPELAALEPVALS